MNVMKFRGTRVVAALALGAAISGVSFLAIGDNAVPMSAQAPIVEAAPQQVAPPGSSCHKHDWMRARIADRLNKMADRMEIKASQQAAWKAYGTVVMSMADASALTRPAAAADAATVLRFRAERSGERAQKLAKLAEATATLQTALTPEQNAVLDQMTRRFAGMEGHKRPLGHSQDQ